MEHPFKTLAPIARICVLQDGLQHQVSDLVVEKNGNTWDIYSPAYQVRLKLTGEIHQNMLDVTLRKEDIQETGSAKIADVTVLPSLFAAACGEEGYLVLPVQLGVRCDYRERAAERMRIPIYNGDSQEGNMACFGLVRAQGCLTGIITAGECTASLETELCFGKTKRYAVAPVFHIREYADDAIADKTFAVRYVYDEGPDQSYVTVARRYREYQLAYRGLRLLKERMAERPALAYAAHAINIRIRQAWKPAPGIPEQTVENEPPVKVAMTFDQVGEMLDRMHAAGLQNAEICLVGWNSKGHDGRYPQVLPAEENLGGEAALKRLTAHAKALGYQITCHDNYYDAYSIAEDWDAQDIILDHAGNMAKGGIWSGGQSYLLCGKVAAEKYLRRNIAAEKELGFFGVHYSDVLSIIGPKKCYHPEHPASKAESADSRRIMLRYFQEEMGGSSSEGFLDFTAPALDRALYVEFGREKLCTRRYVDAVIPLLPIVYHGIVLFNISIESVNSIIKDRSVQLRCAEYGSITQAYVYSGFMTEKKDNWMGQVDLTADDAQDMQRTVDLLKEQTEMFAGITRLQTETIENHEQLSGDVYCTTYANGSRVLVNYGEEPYQDGGGTVDGQSFLVIDK